MNGWMLFVCFLSVWVIAIVYGGRKEWTTTTSVGGGFILACVAFIAIKAGIDFISTSATNTKQRAPIFCNQSLWDGSVPSVDRYLRENLNDPNYQDTDWGNVLKKNGGYRVVVRYRTKNLYGAFRLVYEEFWLDDHCEVIKVIDF